MNTNNIAALSAAITAAIVGYFDSLQGGNSASAVAEDNDGPASTTDVTGQLDSRGFPWDERIHSGAKTTKADGSWTAKKGAAALIPSVEAELVAKGFGQAAAAATTVAPAAPVTPAAPVAPTMPSLTISPVAVTPPT